jgi:hypothetical protein
MWCASDFGKSHCNRQKVLDPVADFTSEKFMPFLSLCVAGHI